MPITPDSIQKALQSENFGDRLRAINDIRKLEPGIGFELIQPALTDTNTRIRYAAVSQMSTLGKQNPQAALPLLRDRLFHDPEVDVQAAAADALCALRLTEAYEDLQTLYHQSSEWIIQLSIVSGLGEMGDPRSFDLLKAALESDYELVRTAAIGAFGELGDEKAVPLLLPFVEDLDWQVRYRVAQALSHLGGEQVQSALKKLATDEVEQVVEAAVPGLSSSLD